MKAIADFSNLTEIYRSEKTIVYTATDDRTSKKIALKILNEEFPSPNLIARFNSEAELGARFENKLEGVRKIIEKRKLGNQYALVMEHIESVSWQEVIKQNVIDLPTALQMAVRAARILGNVHQCGIIHKDINPRNLLVTAAGEVWIIDLGIASVLKRETQQFEAPERLEGTLAYISPEQTGRMNHSIDSRSDLYSLGVTLYELWAGKLPYDTTNPMELVHSHIAKTPSQPKEVRPDLPVILNDIVMKLLSKNVEERYQTAYGLYADLQQCLEICEAQGLEGLQDFRFPLGGEDYKIKFQIPEKLYGRETERELLLDAFHNAENGGVGFLLVGGHSGIGKTSLIRELYKPVTAKRSYFISGKFEQLQRDTPYSAIVQAINDFVQQLLGESDRRLAHWKEEIMKALGTNAGVLTELVPSLERVIGKQPEPVSLPPVESQNRFNRVFQRFFKNLSTLKHTLVIFIDDWQWADQPSLHFLKQLLTAINLRHLLFIAAYRSNEVTPSHPFMTAVEEIEDTDVPVASILLKDLETEHITHLLHDTLRTSFREVAPLAKLIKNKTSGNAFFASQFLQNLYEDGHIRYNLAKNAWEWDIKAIDALPISHNVLDLMTTRLKMLSPHTLEMLKLASCIGNQFSLRLLSELAGKTQLATRHALAEALEQGFILPHKGKQFMVDIEYQDNSVYYKFLHDKVEQSTSQFLSKADYEHNQWRIAQIALNSFPPEYAQEHLFDIANSLNVGKAYAQTQAERRQVAELNYQAGKKAKRSNAYEIAYHFLQTALDFFGETIWEANYEKAFDLYKETAEATFLSGRGNETHLLYETVLQKSQKPIQQAKLYASQLVQLQTEAKFDKAYHLELEGLRLLGVIVPKNEEEALRMFQEENQKLNLLLEKHEIEELADMPEIQDEAAKITIELLTGLFITAFVSSRQMLLAWTITKTTNLSLELGNCPLTSHAYATFGLLSCADISTAERGYRFGRLALSLADKYDNLAVRAKVYHIFATAINHHKQNPKTSIAYFEKAVIFGLEGGEFEYAAFAAFGAVHEGLQTSKDLKQLYQEAQEKASLIKRLNPNAFEWVYEPAVMQPIHNFLGNTYQNYSFDTHDFSEKGFLTKYAKMPLALAWFYSAKLRNLYVFNQYDALYDNLDKITLVEQTHIGIITVPVSQYFGALGILAKWHQLSTLEREAISPTLDKYKGKVTLYAENCPSFYQTRYFLVEAEYLAYVEGKAWEAIELYEKAIQLAKDAEDYQQEGIASERLALFFLHHKKTDLAKVYLQKTLYAFHFWGAEGKVQQLREQYKDMLVQTRREGKKSTIQTMQTTQRDNLRTSSTVGDTSLDLLSVMKASQAISQEIKLENLLRTMVLLLMENAGAERAMIIQERDAHLFAVAEAQLGRQEIEILQHEPLTKEDRDKVALSVILHTYRAHETVILHNAKKDRRFSMDIYIQQGKAKSMLCMPIVSHGETKAIVYMEHSQIEGVFTKERVEVLNMLSSQVAISMENSILYNDMEQKVAKRTRELQEQKELVEAKNTNIIASITYAQRIQQAILPLPENIARLVPEHFVLFQPKDIVSGDFYYMHEKEGKVIMAAIDCTGHGVPGAFMSMLGSETLNEIIQNKGILEADGILNELHRSIRKSLKQKETDNRDGMDLVLLVWDKEKQEVAFAGAKNSLIYIQNNELMQIKGNVFPIGGEQKEANRVFTKHIVPLTPNLPTTFYLLSDGFQDQFGGENNRKFSIKQMKTLFSEIYQQDMETQKDRLRYSLKKWMEKGKEHQIDDVLIFGVRL